MDCYNGIVDPAAVNKEFLKKNLGYLPPDGEWDQLIFGRGSADQLGGVVSAAIATKILIELTDLGALKGAIVRSYGTACEEDNDGAGPMYLQRQVFPTAGAEIIPDVVILTDGSGCSKNGALGIYRGQRGRMQIEVTVTGKSCHGSMPWQGKNPLEFGGAIVKEAADKYDRRIGFKDDKFLGHGTRTASWAGLRHPQRLRRAGALHLPLRPPPHHRRSTPEQSCADVEALDAVAAARQAGLTVDISVPTYTDASWKGYVLNNPQVYLGWLTPEEHPAVQAAVSAYRRVISPHVDGQIGTGGVITKEPRVDRWVFSTDGVGFPVPKEASIPGSVNKNWVVSEVYKHPAMIGFGPGIEQNTHQIGECLDRRELQHCAAFLARYPSVFAQG